MLGRSVIIILLKNWFILINGFLVLSQRLLFCCWDKESANKRFCFKKKNPAWEWWPLTVVMDIAEAWCFGAFGNSRINMHSSNSYYGLFLVINFLCAWPAAWEVWHEFALIEFQGWTFFNDQAITFCFISVYALAWFKVCGKWHFVPVAWFAFFFSPFGN